MEDTIQEAGLDLDAKLSEEYNGGSSNLAPGYEPDEYEYNN